MNERRKSYYDYCNPKTEDDKLDQKTIYNEIFSFRSRTTLRYGDWGNLTGLLSQLAAKNLPRKVLRSVQNKFIKIQNTYQKG